MTGSLMAKLFDHKNNHEAGQGKALLRAVIFRAHLPKR
jgi:hypothetical protein